ncbi:MAG: tetratricopeptide repeat protein [Candidatus Saccharimonadaceae bacterium]
MIQKRLLDLSKLDFEKNRLAKRRKLLLFSLPIVVIALLFSLKFLSIAVCAGFSADSFKKGQYTASSDWLNPLLFLNVFEPYKVHHNKGNALYKLGKFEEAEAQYRRALETVPVDGECAVRVNLALSLEAQADTKASNKDFDAAVILYDKVKAVINDSQQNCNVQLNKPPQDKDQTGESETEDEKKTKESAKKALERINERIKQKSAEAKKDRNGDGDEKSEKEKSDEQKDNNEPSEDQMKKLEEQNAESQKQRMKEKQSNRDHEDYQKAPRDYDVDSW